MPRVKTQRANKDYPEAGIKKGDTYYKWKFRYGGLHRSATYPKRSQLTQSEFLGWLYDIQDNLSSRFEGCEDDLESAVEELTSEIQEQIDELEDKRQNLPDQFQDAGPGEILGERIDGLEGWMSELESISLEVEDGRTAEDIIEELTQTDCGL